MPDDGHKKPVTLRYRLTLLLFAIDVAALVIWFQRHVEPYVNETLIIGSTISLWGLFKMVWTRFEDEGGVDSKDLTQRLLGGPNALSTMVFGAFIIAALHALTGSIYLRFGGAQADEERFKVRVLEGKEAVLGPFEMHPGDVQGGPMIPNLRTRELTFEITDPRGFLPLKRTMYWWSAEDIKVPGSFERKALHLVVFAPDAALYQKLPPVGDSTGVRYYLTVRGRGEPRTLWTLSQQLTVTGAAKEDLPASPDVTADARIRAQLGDRFAQQAALANLLLGSDVATLESAEFGANEAFEVDVGTWEDVGGTRTVVRALTCKVHSPEGDKPETIVIGETKSEICK